MSDDLHTGKQHETWWRNAVVYQVYPRSFADANGDGTGDVAGHHQPPRPPRDPRCGRHLDQPVVPVASVGRRLRRRRLPRHRPAVRHPRRRPPTHRRSSRPGHQDHRRHRSQPHIEWPSMVSRGDRRSDRLRHRGTATSSGLARVPTAPSHRTTGSPSSAAQPGVVSTTASGTSISSMSANPTSIGTTPRCAPSSKTSSASGSTSVSTASASTSPTAS